ncbi:zinc-ribbon domain-containing protein [Chloroflexota bacterium]
MSKKSFPKITGLSCRSLTTNTLSMTTTRSDQIPSLQSKNHMQETQEPKSIQQRKESIAPPTVYICPRCNEYVSGEDGFCNRCGKPIYESTSYYCHKCGNAVEDGWKVCTYCATPLQ